MYVTQITTIIQSLFLNRDQTQHKKGRDEREIYGKISMQR